jgi:hypothetical protein
VSPPPSSTLLTSLVLCDVEKEAILIWRNEGIVCPSQCKEELLREYEYFEDLLVVTDKLVAAHQYIEDLLLVIAVAAQQYIEGLLAVTPVAAQQYIL